MYVYVYVYVYVYAYVYAYVYVYVCVYVCVYVYVHVYVYVCWSLNFFNKIIKKTQMCAFTKLCQALQAKNMSSCHMCS